jgi:hypothetical protein
MATWCANGLNCTVSNKILPGGAILGHSGERDPRYGMQDMLDLIRWTGKATSPGN